MIRQAEPKDAETYASWLKEAEGVNLVDRKVYEYPLATHFVVERRGEPKLMNTIHPVMVMEALAPQPGISPMQEALALNELFNRVKQVAGDTGIKEIMFGCKDEQLAKFIEGRGFERLRFPVFRFRL